MAGEATDRSAGAVGPRGLGGWLILVIFQLVIFLFSGCITLIDLLFNSPVEVATTTAAVFTASAASSPAVQMGLAAAGTAYTALCLFAVLRQKRYAPKLVIMLYLVVVIIAAMNAVMLWRYPALTTAVGTAHSGMLRVASTAFWAAIWIPYFWVSERVGNTFVR